jgi:hypothetical protein
MKPKLAFTVLAVLVMIASSVHAERTPCANQTPMGGPVRCNADSQTCDLYLGGKWTPGELELDGRVYYCKETSIASRPGRGFSTVDRPLVPRANGGFSQPLSVIRVAATVSAASDLLGAVQPATLTARVLPVGGGSVILLVDARGQKHMCLGNEAHCRTMMQN